MLGLVFTLILTAAPQSPSAAAQTPAHERIEAQLASVVLVVGWIDDGEWSEDVSQDEHGVAVRNADVEG